MHHIVCFLLFNTGETYLVYADAQQDSELMYSTIQFVTVSLILMFCQAPAFNSLKSLIGNNSPLLSGGYNDAFVHSSNKKCLLDIFSAGSLYSLAWDGEIKEKRGFDATFLLFYLIIQSKSRKESSSLTESFDSKKKSIQSYFSSPRSL